jgi:hypothetical protein
MRLFLFTSKIEVRGLNLPQVSNLREVSYVLSPEDQLRVE